MAGISRPVVPGYAAPTFDAPDAGAKGKDRGVSNAGELGEYLKALRARTRPEDVGLPPANVNRRVPGLRREELAQLAGVSVDYYTRLEQGRHQHPSHSVVEAVAAALRLDAAERTHLLNLAGDGAHAPRTGSRAQGVRPEMLDLLDALTEQPAFVIGRRTDVLASNALARALIADWHAMPARERNYVRWLFVAPEPRTLYPEWATVAAEAVGTLRLDAGRYPDDPATRNLVGELAMRSDDFRRWWADHRVVERSHGTKRMRHPVVGELEIRYEAMNLPGDPDQTLFVYTTRPHSPSHDAMRLLASWLASEDGPAGRHPSEPTGRETSPDPVAE
jgi:transcriptional regulator with XRE-family HTH domain